MQRPECFEFAMDFLGDPEAPEIRTYVEELEAKQYTLKQLIAELEAANAKSE